MKKGFTLIELLAVIVILAIIALIATPIVLGIIDDTKQSAQIRSAEMYLKGVANAVMKENLEQEGNFKPTECTITSEGNLDCDDKEGILEVEVDGEKPNNGTITFEEGKIKEVTLNYQTGTIIKNEQGNLVYSDEENDSNEGLEMSNVSATLEENDWSTIQQVVAAGKAAETGWKVGDTKKCTVNGDEYDATIIGLNHDGENTATFMIMESIGDHAMYSTMTNEGGWEASEMRAWLNGEIYESMSNTDYIKEVTKMTDNVPDGYAQATGTRDYVFLLSVVETGFISDYDADGEGTTYEWFENNSIGDTYFGLRSSYGDVFFHYDWGSTGHIDIADSSCPMSVFPAFVIGK